MATVGALTNQSKYPALLPRTEEKDSSQKKISSLFNLCMFTLFEYVIETTEVFPEIENVPPLLPQAIGAMRDYVEKNNIKKSDKPRKIVGRFLSTGFCRNLEKIPTPDLTGSHLYRYVCSFIHQHAEMFPNIQRCTLTNKTIRSSNYHHQENIYELYKAPKQFQDEINLVTVLELKNTRIDGEAIESLLNLRNLSHLIFENDSSVYEDVQIEIEKQYDTLFTFCHRFPSLKQLQVSHLNWNIAETYYYPDLMALSIRIFKVDTSRSALSFSIVMPNLLSLSVGESRFKEKNDTTDFFSLLVPALPSLHCFSFDNEYCITLASIESATSAIQGFSKSLYQLNFSGLCYQSTSLKKIQKSFKLDLSQFNELTSLRICFPHPSFLETLSKLENLQVLDVFFTCFELKDSSKLKYIPKGVTQFSFNLSVPKKERFAISSEINKNLTHLTGEKNVRFLDQ